MNSRIHLYTLVDITCTNARRTQDAFKYQQHQNYQSVVQVLSLRGNPIIDSIPKVITPEDIAFGKAYAPLHIWKLTFEIGYASSITMDSLIEDFNYIPIIDNLKESVTFKMPMFNTTDKDYKNILFTFDK